MARTARSRISILRNSSIEIVFIRTHFDFTQNRTNSDVALTIGRSAKGGTCTDIAIKCGEDIPLKLWMDNLYSGYIN